ncbi:GspH/FimT family pseudopilin [Hirschia litorea]|uniref:Type II secretion system protein H n=1 Tax=Hirschia litorea TaxID=1199156 RepID=A0ABW2IHS3_9PROT
MDKLNPSPTHAHENGFTLIELLVVVFIIGLMSSVVVMSMPKGMDDGQEQAANLAKAINSLSREAIASGEAVSWTHIDGQNLFERFHKGEWIALNASSRFVEKSLTTQEIKVSVSLLGIETQRKNLEDKKIKPEPPIIFFPTGEATPAIVRMSSIAYDISYALNTSGKLITTSVNGGVNR